MSKLFKMTPILGMFNFDGFGTNFDEIRLPKIQQLILNWVQFLAELDTIINFFVPVKLNYEISQKYGFPRIPSHSLITPNYS